MKYLSTKDTAEKWKVSDRSVCRAAKDGKIDGAILIGNNWLIPENAGKPLDKRTNKIEVSEKQTDSDYKFPLFVFTKYYIQRNYLSDMELLLLETQELLLRGKFKEAEKNIKLLDNITNKNSPYYLRIGVLHSLIIFSIYTEQFKKYEQYTNELNIIFEKDFPHKEELRLIQLSIQTGFFDNKMLISWEFEKYKDYSRNSIPYLYTTLCFKSFLNELQNKIVSDFTIFEIILNNMIHENFKICAISMCSTLALYYQTHDNLPKAKEKLELALDLMEETGTIELIAEVVPFFIPALNEYGRKYKPHLAEAVTEMVILQKKSILHISAQKSGIPGIANLTPKEMDLIPGIIQGQSNQELADLFGISRDTISKRLSSIYQKTFTSNRKELKEYFINMMGTSSL